MRVLVIEDDANITRSIELMLKSEGHDCDHAELGEDGINQGKLHHYDVIILDLMLPDMEGYEVVRQLRSHMVATPILILSGLAELDSKVKGLGVGADDYLTKPFDRDELIARVEALVRRSMGYSATPDLGQPTGALLAKKGGAAPWSFSMAYTPYGSDETPEAAEEAAGDSAGDSAGLGEVGEAPGGEPALNPGAVAGLQPGRPRSVIRFPSQDDLVEDSGDEGPIATDGTDETDDAEAHEAPADSPSADSPSADSPSAGRSVDSLFGAEPVEPAAELLKVPESGEIESKSDIRMQALGSGGATRERIEGAGRVIVLGNEKGGTGKSTTAMHLIVALLRDGHTVASVDLDTRQATLSRFLENRRVFAEKRELELPLPARHVGDLADASPEALEEIFEDCIATYDYVVVDTPGSETALSHVAHEWADTLIAPINDSLVDLDVFAQVEAETLEIKGLSHYADMVVGARKLKAERTGEPTDWIVLRNRLSTLHARNKQNVGDILKRLAGLIGFREGPGLSERVIYRELFLSGLTLLDLRDRGIDIEFTMSHVAARQELRALLQAIQPGDARPAEDQAMPAAAAKA